MVEDYRAQRGRALDEVSEVLHILCELRQHKLVKKCSRRKALPASIRRAVIGWPCEGDGGDGDDGRPRKRNIGVEVSIAVIKGASDPGFAVAPLLSGFIMWEGWLGVIVASRSISSSPMRRTC